MSSISVLNELFNLIFLVCARKAKLPFCVYSWYHRTVINKLFLYTTSTVWLKFWKERNTLSAGIRRVLEIENTMFFFIIRFFCCNINNGGLLIVYWSVNMLQNSRWLQNTISLFFQKVHIISVNFNILLSIITEVSPSWHPKSSKKRYWHLFGFVHS